MGDKAVKETKEVTADIGSAVLQGLKAKKRKSKAAKDSAAKDAQDEGSVAEEGPVVAEQASPAKKSRTETMGPAAAAAGVSEAAPTAAPAVVEFDRIDLQKVESMEKMQEHGLDHLK